MTMITVNRTEELNKLNTVVTELSIRRNELIKNRDKYNTRKKQLEDKYNNRTEVREIIREVGIMTQSQLSMHIKEIVELGIKAVFGEGLYGVNVSFDKKRDRTECVINLIDGNGDEFKPLDMVGGGVIDVVAFALRLACWSISMPKPSNIILLDEPFRYLSSDLTANAGKLLDKLSERLGIQFIVVTHDEELITGKGSKVFNISIKGGVSKVNG